MVATTFDKYHIHAKYDGEENKDAQGAGAIVLHIDAADLADFDDTSDSIGYF